MQKRSLRLCVCLSWELSNELHTLEQTNLESPLLFAFRYKYGSNGRRKYFGELVLFYTKNLRRFVVLNNSPFCMLSANIDVFVVNPSHICYWLERISLLSRVRFITGVKCVFGLRSQEHLSPFYWPAPPPAKVEKMSLNLPSAVW